MYHERKIVLFISHIYGHYQTELSQGIIDQAASYGYRTEIYTSNDGEDLGTFLLGEASLLDIPRFVSDDPSALRAEADRYAGIVFASNTYSSRTLRDQITDRLRELPGIPVIEINDADPVFPAVQFENNEMIGELTEHLITTHGCRRICYLGCANEDFYSSRRLAAYEGAMRSHDLSMAPDDVLAIDESDESYRLALDTFTRSGKDIPDAVVCYNDRVALRFWSEAQTAGIRIPEDMKLTGCDDSVTGGRITPPLATVSYPVREVGARAVGSLWRMIHSLEMREDRTVRAEPVCRGTCGCSYPRTQRRSLYAQTMQDQQDDLERSIFFSVHMSSALSQAKTLKEGMAILRQLLMGHLPGAGFFLCLNPGWDRPSGRVLSLTGEEDAEEDDNRKYLALAMIGDRGIEECSFPASSLLPEHLIGDPGGTQIVSPLFFEERVFGYAVFTWREGEVRYPFKLVQWLVNISQFLENLRERKSRHLLTEHLEEVYLKDILTGLYNRHGFNRFASEYLEAVGDRDMVSLIFVDVKSLRGINDEHGHREGDFALSTVGQAIQSCASSGEICAKFNSGEFYILLIGGPDAADALIARISSWLSRYNELGDKPYRIEIACGSSSCRRALLAKPSGMDVLMTAAQRTE